MRAWRRFGAGQHWRPWLGISRRELEAYVALYGIAHIDDHSNGDQRFERNFLRQQVLPLLQTRWPQAARQLADEFEAWLAQPAAARVQPL